MEKVLYSVNKKEVKLHISKGNNKIGKGIWSFSTLPGNSKNLIYLGDKTLLTDVPGTCSKYCKGCFKGGCYAVNSAKLHHNAVIPAWAENTLLLRSGRLFEMLDNYIRQKNLKYYKTKNDKDLVIKTFRVNVSGEIENLQQFNGWNSLAEKHPEVAFGVYTKNFDVLDKFLQGGGTIAKNFIVNISQWNHVADKFLAKYPNQFNVFEYDETNRKSCTWSQKDRDRLAKIPKCPAVDIKGHHAKTPDGKEITCDMCRRCYTKTGKHTAVYSH